MGKPDKDRRIAEQVSSPRRGRRPDTTAIVKQAIEIQSRLGTMCAVELMRANGVPADVIARVLQDGDCRAADKP